MLVLHRRGLWSGLVSAACFSTEHWAQPTASFDSLVDVAQFVCTYTPLEFRESVHTSGGHFLYRGDGVASVQSSSSGARIVCPEPDLLVAGTYTDDGALDYFKCIERQLKSSKAKPSTGHMGTSIYEDAAAWGNVVSVWPIGTQLSYVWSGDARNFFPESRCPDDSLIVDDNLSDALMKGREVLFASWESSDPIQTPPRSSFLTVPTRHDRMLKQLLESLHYGLT